MAIKPEDKVLTYQQARELKFFMDNCSGTRVDFYELVDRMEAFKGRLDRLDQTAKMINDFFGKEIADWEAKIQAMVAEKCAGTDKVGAIVP